MVRKSSRFDEEKIQKTTESDFLCGDLNEGGHKHLGPEFLSTQKKDHITQRKNRLYEK